LQDQSDKEGIAWRAYKLKYALDKNSKLINPQLSAEKQRQIKIMLLDAAACLATCIEDLTTPCAVEPVDIPTTSPPIR
jgi:hypothetical protein